MDIDPREAALGVKRRIQRVDVILTEAEVRDAQKNTKKGVRDASKILIECPGTLAALITAWTRWSVSERL